METFADLQALLQVGNVLDFYWESQGPQNLTISVRKIADLVVTSGIIVACDLYMVPDPRNYLKNAVTPGRYPVFISVADFQPVGDTRIACARLKLGNSRAIRWETAFFNQPAADGPDDLTHYGVDARTACFVDVDIAKIVSNLCSLEIRYPEKDEFLLFCDRLTETMEANSFGKYPLTASWADMKINENEEGNMVAFSSGWGDGGYLSFWGYDAEDQLTSLVTDFEPFPKQTMK